MFKSFLLSILFTASSIACFAQESDDYLIRKSLFDHTQLWNKNDLDGFMKNYWNSDSLVFIGSKGLTYGYQTVLDNYKKAYSTPEKMGKLKLTIKQMTPIGKDYYLVIGQWDIVAASGNSSGHFSLTWKKIKGEWKIIADHSS